MDVLEKKDATFAHDRLLRVALVAEAAGPTLTAGR
jgi:hypothetical protein